MRGDKQTWNPFPASEWVAWIGATVAAALTGLAFAYSTFETKESARDHEGTIIQRLDRMEGKQDRMESKIDELRGRAPARRDD